MDEGVDYSDMELEKIRKELDEVDRQIVELYEKRMALACEVAESKRTSGKNVFDKAREDAKLKSVSGLVKKPEYRQGVQDLFGQLMGSSRKLQYSILASDDKGSLPFAPVDALNKKAAVVFQGAEGSYSEEAAHTFFSETAEFFHTDTFRNAMLALDEGRAEYAVLPIENSTAGIVSEIYDLMAEFEHYIVGEQMIKIEHCLLGCEGTTLDSIHTVYSHPQSLMQSERFLRSYPEWKIISMSNNAFAAKKVADEKDISQAAIAGEHAAKVYGLDIIQKGVNHSDTNTTRFIVVSNRKIFVKNAKKISLCFEVPDESGSLYRMLSHFIYNNINMKKIESRPIEGRNWEYRFFLDFEGNLSDPGVKNALCGLREEARSLRILGNY